MALIKKVAKNLLFGGVVGLGKSLLGGKKKMPLAPLPLPGATRDDAEVLAAREEELRRRKGGASDILNGVTGAEAAMSAGRLIPGS